MIQINFVARETAARKARNIRKASLLVYISICIFLAFLSAIDFFEIQGRVEKKTAELDSFKKGIEKIHPRFVEAADLYHKRNEYIKSLQPVCGKALDSGQIRQVLSGIGEQLPANFWLTEITFGALDSHKSDDNKNIASFSRALTIKGNVFFEAESGNKQQVQDFVVRLKKQSLFRSATPRLSLDKTKISKVGSQYYHNFELSLEWPESVL